MPPALHWEAPVWALYMLLQHQWRHGFSGRTGLDFGPALRLIEARGWEVDLAIQLLHSIEHEVLTQEASRGGSGQG